MTDEKTNNNPLGVLLSKSQTFVDELGIPISEVKSFGRTISDVYYAGMNGRFPAKDTRRLPKEGQFFAIGALGLFVLGQNRELLKDLPTGGTTSCPGCGAAAMKSVDVREAQEPTTTSEASSAEA